MMDYYTKQAADRLAASCGTSRDAVVLLATIAMRYIRGSIGRADNAELSRAIQLAQQDVSRIAGQTLDAMAQSERSPDDRTQKDESTDLLNLMIHQVREEVCND